MKRRDAREAVFALIFDKDFNPDITCREVLDSAVENGHIEGWDDDPYVSRVFFGVYENLEELDAEIDKASLRWESDRISRVSRAILRLALYEIKNEEDVPTRIAVNEAVELAKKFDDEKAFSFINGILGAIATDFDD